MASETVRRSPAAATSALPSPALSGASIEELEALWATLERSRDAHAGDPNAWCKLANSDGTLCAQVLELASVELYRRLVAAHQAARGGA